MKNRGKTLLILILITLLLGLIFRIFVPKYEYNKSDILSPDYVHIDTLIVTKSFNLPDSLESDEDIAKYISNYTKPYRNE